MSALDPGRTSRALSLTVEPLTDSRYHVTGGADAATFQPMNVNFGLFPPLDEPVKRKERKPALARRALADLDAWLVGQREAAE